MDIHKISLFFLIIFLKILKQNQSYIILDFFNEKNLSKINSSTFFEEILYNRLVSKIPIGIPKQILFLSIKLRLSTLAVTSNLSKFNKHIPKYKLNFSTTYYSDNFSEIINFGIDEFKKGIKSKELFEFPLNKRANLNFILTTDTFCEDSGIFGLKLEYDNKNLGNYSLLKQLKENNIISSYVFFFIFENLDISPLNYKGKLIIGKYPHEYNPKKYIKDNYFQIKTFYNFNSFNEYFEIKHFEIFYGDIENNQNDFTDEIITQFDFSKSNILGTSKFKKFITKEFNELYKDKCIEILDKLVYFKCDNDIDINKLKSIYIFYGNHNFTFELKPSDLFALYDNKLYYLINFYKNSESTIWSFGIIFLKKYLFVFDQDKKIIGYYKNKENIHDNSQLYLKILLLFSFIIIIVLLYYFIHHLFFIKKRKIRANELEDNIDYLPFNIKL